jgi:hypothetical protein
MDAQLIEPDQLEVGAGIHYPINHAVTDDYEKITGEELEGLHKSLCEHGLLVPIVIWKGTIVDGEHRYLLGCNIPDFVFRYRDITQSCPTEEKMRAYVRGLNEHRRSNTKPLKTAEKRALIAKTLRANPNRSDAAIGLELGVDDKTVASVRRGMETSSEIPRMGTRSDKKGHDRPAKTAQRSPRRQPPTPSLPVMPPQPIQPLDDTEREPDPPQLTTQTTLPGLVVASPLEILKVIEKVRRSYPGDREVQFLCNWAEPRAVNEQQQKSGSA